MGWTELNMLLILIVWGGGQDRPCKARFSENCPCSHYNNISSMKQISLYSNRLGFNGRSADNNSGEDPFNSDRVPN